MAGIPSGRAKLRTRENAGPRKTASGKTRRRPPAPASERKESTCMSKEWRPEVLPDPPYVQTIFASTRAAWFWTLVRLYVGWQWLNAGWGKLHNPAWVSRSEERRVGKEWRAGWGRLH